MGRSGTSPGDVGLEEEDSVEGAGTDRTAGLAAGGRLELPEIQDPKDRLSLGVDPTLAGVDATGCRQPGGR